MFDTVLIDFSVFNDDPNTVDSRELALTPFLYLIANHVVEAGLPAPRLSPPDFVSRALTLVEGRPHIIDSAKDGRGPYFSASKTLKAGVLRSTGITMENSVLLLAAAGLQITIPSLTFDVARSEEVTKLRTQLGEERNTYLEAMTRMADETYQRLKDGFYKDTVDWALNEAFLKIEPKAQAFDRAVLKLERPLLERLSMGFIKEGIPRIGGTLVDSGIKAAAKASIEEVLRTLATNLARHIEERRVPEVVYGYKVSRSLPS